MSSISDIYNPSRLEVSSPTPTPLMVRIKDVSYRWFVRILNKHTDLISSCGILAITTCLLAGKIFQSMPKILPRIAKVVFDFGGIIWLNVQVRDLLKSGRDLSRSCHHSEWQAAVEVAAKVFVKGVNIILTSAFFCGSFVAACGFPQTMLALALAVRPLGLACLGLNILTDVRDYFVNETVLERLSLIEDGDPRGVTVAKVMTCFLEIVVQHKATRDISGPWVEEKRLARVLVRQLDTQTLETFREMLAKEREKENPRLDAIKLFYSVKDGMRSKQAGTKANISLILLGYLSMGLCRAFPESLIEMGTRWGMSVLYTDELIRQKLFQKDLQDLPSG